MKRNLLGFLGILFIFTITLYALSPKEHYPDLFIGLPGEVQAENIDYNFIASTSHIPKKEKVFMTSNPKISKETLIELGKKFELNSSNIVEDDKNLMLIDGNKKLKVDLSNGFFSYIDENVFGNNEIKRNLPTDEECKTIASNYLREKGLLPERFSNIIITSATSISSSGDQSNLYKVVYFYPTIDNKPVFGLSRIIVTVGNNGYIETVDKYYRDFDIKTFSEASLKTVDEAFSDVKNGKSSNSLPFNANKATINKVDIGYWEDPDSNYLQPVFVFKGETTIDGLVKTFDAFVPAVKGVSIKQNDDEETFDSTPKPPK